MLRKLSVALLCVSALSNCGGSRKIGLPPVSQQLSLQVGSSQTLLDRARSTQTTFTIVSVGRWGCDADVADMYITKSGTDPQKVADSYWSPGTTGYVHFYLKITPDGQQIYSTGQAAFNYQTGTLTGTWAWHSPDTIGPRPYVINDDFLPPVYIAPTQHYFAAGQHDECLQADAPGVGVGGVGSWTTAQSVEWVTAPKYEGWATCYRYSEGTYPTAQPWDKSGENNAEKWCFAERKLVQLENLHQHIIGIDWRNGCKVTGWQNSNELAGVNWGRGCQLPEDSPLRVELISPMLLKLVNYKNP